MKLKNLIEEYYYWQLLVYTAQLASLTWNSLSVNCLLKGRWAAIANFLLNDRHYGLCCCHLASIIKNSISNCKNLFIDFEIVVCAINCHLYICLFAGPNIVNMHCIFLYS